MFLYIEELNSNIFQNCSIFTITVIILKKTLDIYFQIHISLLLKIIYIVMTRQLV